jgi:hypothetical protein
MHYSVVKYYENFLFYLFIYSQFILRRFFSNVDYIESNDRMAMELWIIKDLEGSGRGLIWTPGGTEENDETPQPG